MTLKYIWSFYIKGASKLTMCDTDVCQQASRKYKGFTCISNNDSSSNCTFQSPCTIHKCGEYGKCHVKTDGLNYVHLCRWVVWLCFFWWLLLIYERKAYGVILPTIKIALLYQGLNGVARRIKIYLDSK